MAAHPKSVPLVAPGHTRPVTHLSFSPLQDDGTYVLISSCKDGNPMLREWTGDWIGTFFGHKGAVWSSKLTPDTSRAASGSADFTACVLSLPCLQAFQRSYYNVMLTYSSMSPTAKYGTRIAGKYYTPFRTIILSAVWQLHQTDYICLPVGRRRRSGCSI